MSNTISYIDAGGESISSETISKIRTKKCVKRPVVHKYFIAPTAMNIRRFENDILVSAQTVKAGDVVYTSEDGTDVWATSMDYFTKHYDAINERID